MRRTAERLIDGGTSECGKRFWGILGDSIRGDQLLFAGLGLSVSCGLFFTTEGMWVVYHGGGNERGAQSRLRSKITRRSASSSDPK